ncbi:helix-turn-helix transcriptional regulator [Pseudoalteromonas sp. ACER1]|uniref:helix-turn-helix domain-containing protein n=1 Tax=unclassified Pseudoalteromonas TaxID=194690 RepID=UPI0034362392
MRKKLGFKKKTTQSKAGAALAVWLKEKRLSANLTQKEVASRIGRSISYISRVEVNSQILDIPELITYCTAINTDPSDGLRVVINSEKED